MENQKSTQPEGKGDLSLVSIGQAARILEVSIDSLRRWEKKGLIRTVRTPGGTRKFRISDLQSFKAARPLTVSKTASRLGVSSAALRRLDSQGLVSPQRGVNGERLYDREALDKLSKLNLKAKKPRSSEPRTANPESRIPINISGSFLERELADQHGALGMDVTAPGEGIQLTPPAPVPGELVQPTLEPRTQNPEISSALTQPPSLTPEIASAQAPRNDDLAEINAPRIIPQSPSLEAPVDPLATLDIADPAQLAQQEATIPLPEPVPYEQPGFFARHRGLFASAAFMLLAGLVVLGGWTGYARLTRRGAADVQSQPVSTIPAATLNSVEKISVDDAQSVIFNAQLVGTQGLEVNGDATITDLISCDSIDTDATGTLVCGVDSDTATVFTLPQDLDVTATPTFAGLNLSSPLEVASGGTGVSGTPQDGELLIGNGSGFSLNTITAGTGVTVTNGSGSITISASGTCGTCVELQASTPGTQQIGHINVSGTIIAGNFSGDGSALSGLDADNITTGTLADARLSANVSLLGQTISNAELENSTVNFGGVTVALGGSDLTPAFDLTDAFNLNINTGTTGTLLATRGGTGQTAVTTGDLLYGSAADTWSRLGIGSTGNCLTVAGGVPVWGTCAGGGSGVTLQAAYDNSTNPATITTADGKNIRITLQDTATDQTFEISQAGTADILRINDDGTYTDTTPFVIDGSGNVGIGDASPAALLTVGSGDLFQIASNGNLTTSNAGTWTFSNDTNFALSGGVNGLSIDGTTFSVDATNDRLGIGTASPSFDLHVQKASATNVEIAVVNTTSGTSSLAVFRASTNTAEGFVLVAPDTYTALPILADRISLYSAANASGINLVTQAAAGDIRMFTGGTATTNERLRITSAGNVGIGDTSPAALFTVGSGDLFQVASNGNLTSSNAGTWTFSNDTNFVASGGVNGISFDGTTLSVDATNDRIGIGTAAPSTTLHVAGGARITGLVSCDTIDTDANGVLSCGSDATGGGGGAATLQEAYEGAPTINVTSAEGELAITLTSEDFSLTTPTGGTNFTSIIRADGSGTSDPAQLLLLDNLDTDRAQPIGLKIQSAGGGITTAIDLSDSDIVTALDIGANDIVASGATISAAELNLLDGHDVALVDINDAVNTAITGVGTLSSGTLALDSLSYTGTLDDANVNDVLTISSAGSVDWLALTNYPTACAAGSAVSTLADVPTCTAFNTDTSITLQDAYDASASPATITTADGKNIRITLQDTTTDQTFEISQAGTALAFRVNDDGTYTDTSPFAVDSDGDVGIGTASPAYKLHIAGDYVFSAATDLTGNVLTIKNTSNNNQLQLASDGTNNIGIIQAAQPGTGYRNLVLQPTSGNVGIGDTSPAALFTVGSGDLFQVASNGNLTTSNAGTWTFSNDTNFTLSGGVNGLSFDGATFSVDATNDRIGIGTAAPTNKLDVRGGAYFGNSDLSSIPGNVVIQDATASAGSSLGITTNGNVASSVLGINFIDRINATSQGAEGQIGTFIRSERSASSAAFRLLFGTSDGSDLGADAVTKVVIDTNGNFGIGDTSPASLLTVGSGDAFQVNASGQVVSGAWQGTAVGATFGGTGQTAVTTGDLLYGSASNTWSRLAAGGDGTCLKISGSTPVWSSSCAGGTGGGGTVTLQDAYNNSSNPATITTADGKNIRITLQDTTTDQTFEISQAGTADAFRVNDDGTYTDTTPFVIDASGQVGIGTSAPTQRLYVSGDSGSQRIVLDSADGTGNHALGFYDGGTEDWLLQRHDSTGRLEIVESGVGSHLVILPGGNVGIGDSSPAALFTVGSGDLFQVNSSGDITTASGENLGITAGGTGDIIVTTDADTSLQITGLGTASGSALCVDGSNNVVTCGTGSSSATLQSAYAAGNTITTTDARNIDITLADTTTDSSLRITQAGTANALFVGDDGTFTDTTPFVIDASGNVGIGTSAPGSNLEIAALSGTSYKGNVRIATDGVQMGYSLLQLNSGYSNPFTSATVQGFNSGDPINADFTGMLTNWTAASGGLVAIGTSNGSGVPAFVVEANQGVEGTTRAAIYLNAGTTNGAGGVQAIASANNVFQVANNALALMTILGSGNVGIGDTSPASLLTVGSGDLFQVNSSGQLVAGSITSGFGAIDVGADNITTTGTVFGNTFDRSTAGALSIGGSTSTSVGICNSTACDVINIGTTTDADTITIGEINDTLNVDAVANFSTDVTLNLADTENLVVLNTVTGTNSIDLISSTLTNNTTSGTQQVALLRNDPGSGTTETLLLLRNADTDTAVTDGLSVTSAAGTITDAIDVSDTNIVNAINVGDNNIIGTTPVINFTNFDLDASGNITNATWQGNTVAVGFGGTGATSFTANGVLYGNGTSALGVTAAGTTGQCLVATTGSAPAWGSCAGTGSGSTLQAVYDNGNSITTTDARDIDITLADTATDSNLDIDIAADNTVSISRLNNAVTEAPAQLLLIENLDTDLTVADGISIQSAGAARITDAFDASDADIDNAINVGDNFILGNGIRQFSSSSTVWTVEDTAGNDLLTITDNGTNGNVLVTNDLTTTGDVIVNGGDLLGAATTNLLNTSTTINLGDSTTSKTIDIGSVTNSSSDTINIATNGTAADTIAIGNSNASTTLALTGGDDWSITGAGAATFNGNTILGNASSDTLTVNAAATFTTDVNFNLAETENLDITNTVTGTNGVDLFRVDLTNNTTSGSQRIAVINNTAGSGVTDVLLQLTNSDTDTVVTDGLLITAATGGITDGIDVSHTNIDNALNVGDNNIIGTTPVINFTNFDLDASGNITNATWQGNTVAVGFGGTGATSFTANGVLYGNGSSALGVTAAGTTGQCLVATTGSAPSWGSCAGTGSGVTLQAAYDNSSSPATITTADGKDIVFSLADTTTDSDFIVDLVGTGNTFEVRDGGTAFFTAADARALTYAAGNAGTFTVTSALSLGARSTYPLVISQANDATNNNSVGLLQLNNQDTGSTAAVLNITQAATSGTGISFTTLTGGISVLVANTSGTALNANTVTTGTGLTATGLSTGNGVALGGTAFTTGNGILFNTTANAATTGNAIDITGAASAITADLSGHYINVNPTRTLTAAATRTDSANFLNLTRSNTVNNASGTYNVTGDLVNLQSNCTQTAGTCTDTANILSLNQQYANASGAVIDVTGAGTGNLAVLDATNASANGVSVDVQSSSSSQYALQVTSNNGATTGLYVRADGNVGIGDASPAALFTVGSGDLFQVVSTGHARGIDGSASAPSYSFTSDTDTGLYSAAANALSLATGGVERIHINSSGNVGIGGTASGSAVLSVQGSDPFVFIRNSDAASATNENTLDFRLNSDSTERSFFRIDVTSQTITDASRTSLVEFNTNNAGTFGAAMVIQGANVGIGDTTPAALFTVGTSDALQVTSGGNITSTATGTALTLSGAATTAIQISNTGVTTDINLQNGETIDNNTDGVITLTGIAAVTSLGSSGTTALCRNGSNQIADCTGGGANTLQGAYDGGNTITTTDARDIDIVLDNTTTDSDLDIDIVGGNTVSITRLDNAVTDNPARLLLLANLDTDLTVADGIQIQSAGAARLTDAIDASDSDIDNAINAGDNFVLFNGIRAFSSSATVLTVEDTAGNDLLTITDAGTTGNLVVSNNITATGDVIVNGGDLTGAATFNLLNTGSTTINFGGGATTALNIGDSTSNVLIDIGGVTSSAANTINIATNGTAADTIAIGNSNASTTLALTGGDDWSITTGGNITSAATGTALTLSGAATTAIQISNTGVTTDINLQNGETIDNNTDGEIRVSGHFNPTSNDALDLGSNTLRWRDLYLGGETIHLGTSTTDEGTISYNTTTNIFNFGTDSTTNGDIAFFDDDLYLDKSSGNVGINTTANLDFRLEVNGNIGASSAPSTASITRTATLVDDGATGTDDVGELSSTAIGLDGNPVISYYDVTNGNLRFTKCGNALCSSGNTTTVLDGDGTCAGTGTNCSSGDVGQYTSLAIGTDGFPVISYYDVTGTAGAGDLRVLKCGNAACTSGNTISVPTTTNDRGKWNSIAIAKNGNPVVSYHDDTANQLHILICGNSACNSGNSLVGLDASADVGLNSSVAITTDGVPIVAYHDQTNGKLKIIKCSDAACSGGTITTISSGSDDIGEWARIKIGRDGLPIIAHHNNTSFDLMTTKCTSSGSNPCSSTLTYTLDSTDDVGSRLALAIGADGLPIISYRDFTAGNLNLKVSHCNDLNCSTRTNSTVESTNDVGFGSGIAIGADGMPFISHHDNTAGAGASSLRTLKCANYDCTATSGTSLTGGMDLGALNAPMRSMYFTTLNQGMEGARVQLNSDGNFFANNLFAGSNGNVGIGTVSPTEMLTLGGNILIGSQQNRTSDFAKVSNATAGTIASGGTASIDSPRSFANYNGSLYMGTAKTDAAEIYRYDGTSGSWTKVSQATAGTIASGGTANIDQVQSLAVWNGHLYAGTFEVNSAEVYRYDGGTTWTKVSQATAGTIASGGRTGINGAVEMAVWGGNLYLATDESNATEVYRYNGGTSWSQVTGTDGQPCDSGQTSVDQIRALAVWENQLYLGTEEANLAEICRYNGGTSWTRQSAGAGTIEGGGTANINEVRSLVVYNGALYAGTFESNAAEIYRFNNGGNWTKVSQSTAGTIASGGTASIDGVETMTVYNGRLYAGTAEANSAEVYRYDGGSTWTKVSSATAGTIVSGGTASIDEAKVLIPYSNKLYLGSGEGAAAEVYEYQAIEGQSYSLMFNGVSDNGGGEQNSLLNTAAISFAAEQSGLGATSGFGTGSFLFSHGINGVSGAYDIAEDYGTRDDSLAAGDLVSVDPSERTFVKKTRDAYDSTAIGVYSEKPGLRLSQKDSTINGGRAVPIALAGRVPVKVTDEGGAIRPGDHLTSSSTPGHAMKTSAAGPAIGIALEGFNGATGKIEMFVNPTYYVPTGDSLVQSANASFGDLNVSGLATIKDLKVTGTLEVAELVVNGHIVTAGDAPQGGEGAGAGSGASISVSGNDTAGTVEITAGAGGEAGVLAKITFKKAFGQRPRVSLTPVSSGAADLRYFVVATADGFEIRVKDVPVDGAEYSFDYFVIE